MVEFFRDRHEQVRQFRSAELKEENNEREVQENSIIRLLYKINKCK